MLSCPFLQGSGLKYKPSILNGKLEYIRSRMMRLLLSDICSQAWIAFSKAFAKREQSSVLLKGSKSGGFACTVCRITPCFALVAKANKIRLTVSFSQKRLGVILDKVVRF